MDRLAKIASKLSVASEKKYTNPYTEFSWPVSLDGDCWYFSPELISLYGTETYNALSEQERKRLSFWEAVNFFSLNIHGEQTLIQGLADRLYKQWPDEISQYLHHFLDEENKHMVMFGNFCTRYGKKTYADKKVNFPHDMQRGEADFLFFAKIVIFEELVDVYNIRMGSDARLHPLVQQINSYHHGDESRHLAFGREIALQLYKDNVNQWAAETLERVRRYLADYIVATWKEYYNPSVYEDAGLANSYELYEITWGSQEARSRRFDISKNCLKFFRDSGILPDGVDLQ